MLSRARLAGWLLPALFGLCIPSAFGEPLLVAVSSNFRPAMEALEPEFESLTGLSLELSYGSTGKHYAQIVNGAPFDVFLAADAERPKRLEEDGQAIAGSRFVYAKGTLVLWRPDGDGPEDVLPALNQGDFRFLAIANPRTAPYGTAAEQVLRRLELWDALQSRIVRGENVAQAYGFVKSGHAQLGFVALAQLVGQAERGPGTWWVVPEDHYAPIEQQAVLLRDTEPAWAFARFLQAPSTAATLRSLGYGLPQ